MKFAFIFGKGTDGCGVTRGALIFEEWLIKNGHSTLIFSFETKQVLLRGKGAPFKGEVTTVKHEEYDIPNEIVKAVNACDVAIFHNYPTRKTAEASEKLLRFIQKVESLKVMHDHGVSSNTINSVPQAGEFFSYADVVVAQSTVGLTSCAYTKFDPSLQGRVIENPIWFDSESIKQYDLPFEERRRVLNFTGRNSPVKQIGLVPKTIPRILDHGWTGELMGVERSINAISSITESSPLQEKYRHLIQYWAQNKHSKKCRVTGGFLSEDAAFVPIYCTDRFAYGEGMGALGSSMASWAGYRLTDTKEYGSRMEYTQIEACLLSVPILNVDFAADAKSSEGVSWGSYGFFLTSNLDSDEQLAEDLIRLGESPKEWTIRHESSRELISRLFDVENLAPKFIQDVMALGKKPEGLRGLDLVHWWPEAESLRLDGKIIMTTAHSVLNERKLIMEGTKQREFK